MAIWARELYIVIPLSLALLGFGGVLLRGVIGVTDIWVDGSGCTIVTSQMPILRTIYIYGMCLDFIVLCLTVWKLGFAKERGGGLRRMPLLTLLLRDGVLYFVIT